MNKKWYCDISDILERQPESQLAYLYGCRADDISDWPKPRFFGSLAFLHVLYVLCRIVANTKSVRRPLFCQPVDQLIFTSSNNQSAALKTTTTSLLKQGQAVCWVSLQKGPTKDEEQAPHPSQLNFELTLLQSIKSILFLFFRLPKLLGRGWLLKLLKKSDYLWFFMSSYMFLIYFYDLFNSSKPKIVICSNDHNVENRSMIAIAHHLKIKTAYLQHASVSDLFPALDFDFAFLDGQYASDKYRSCAGEANVRSNETGKTKIILSGQKKTLHQNNLLVRENIGVALNEFDKININAWIQYIMTLCALGYRIKVRLHPAFSDKDRAEIYASIAQSDGIVISEPEVEPVGHFLNSVWVLIAGCSSIHLEAAIAGAVPVHFDGWNEEPYDYYDYVRNGVAIAIGNFDDLRVAIQNRFSGWMPSRAAIQFYSSTYGTDWQGREGELVAFHLLTEC